MKIAIGMTLLVIGLMLLAPTFIVTGFWPTVIVGCISLTSMIGGILVFNQA